jgi:hypothetical protein
MFRTIFFSPLRSFRRNSINKSCVDSRSSFDLALALILSSILTIFSYFFANLLFNFLGISIHQSKQQMISARYNPEGLDLLAVSVYNKQKSSCSALGSMAQSILNAGAHKVLIAVENVKSGCKTDKFSYINLSAILAFALSDGASYYEDIKIPEIHLGKKLNDPLNRALLHKKLVIVVDKSLKTERYGLGVNESSIISKSLNYALSKKANFEFANIYTNLVLFLTGIGLLYFLEIVSTTFFMSNLLSILVVCCLTLANVSYFGTIISPITLSCFGMILTTINLTRLKSHSTDVSRILNEQKLNYTKNSFNPRLKVKDLVGVGFPNCSIGIYSYCSNTKSFKIERQFSDEDLPKTLGFENEKVKNAVVEGRIVKLNSSNSVTEISSSYFLPIFVLGSIRGALTLKPQGSSLLMRASESIDLLKFLESELSLTVAEALKLNSPSVNYFHREKMLLDKLVEDSAFPLGYIAASDWQFVANKRMRNLINALGHDSKDLLSLLRNVCKLQEDEIINLITKLAKGDNLAIELMVQNRLVTFIFRSTQSGGDSSILKKVNGFNLQVVPGFYCEAKVEELTQNLTLTESSKRVSA